jgi:hypothetical protein
MLLAIGYGLWAIGQSTGLTRLDHALSWRAEKNGACKSLVKDIFGDMSICCTATHWVAGNSQ